MYTRQVAYALRLVFLSGGNVSSRSLFAAPISFQRSSRGDL